jgi:hypothetical protein
MKRAIEFLFSGMLVYGLVVACGAADEKDAHPPLHAAGGGGGSTGVDGASGTGVDSAADALIDVLMDPVREADAQVPVGPTVVTSPCNIEVQYTAGASLWFAEASFPGKTLNELARLTAYTSYPNQTPTPSPTGYRNQVVLPVIQPGKAAVACGSGSGGSSMTKAESVTFVLP